MRAPRPWTASLQRPAAKILVAGGLTLAGWLLGAALSGNTASAAEQPACPEAPAVSTVDHAAKPFAHGRHRKSHRETGIDACAAQPKTDAGSGTDPGETPSTGETPPSETPPTAETQPVGDAPKQADETTAEPTKDTKDTAATSAAEEPAVATKATSSGGDLLGGLVGGVLNVVGGTLTTVTSTVGTVTDTLSHTVLAPLTQPIGGNPDAPVLLPLDDVLAPVFGGSSNSGGVTAIVPGLVTGTATQAAGAVLTEAPPVAAPVTAAVPQQSPSRVAVAHVIVRHQELPVVQDRPRDSGVHASGGGGDSTPGLPGGTTAPSAPAPTAAPGHDGPGGARHAFAVHTDVTTTQLKLIGASRDHDVDGAGREAALPTTSPD
ncbi:hypothetical protein [Amycolatopsis sp. NPDC021455]|uniref:hypothetical protein n=1 Tax=Amycolatopsis sp. NPDC021455 TaxID=3154901 RepID=UPI0033E88409